MNFDRRRSLRLPVDLQVQWRRGQRLHMLRAHDINTGGLFVLTEEKIPVDNVMELKVILPAGPVSFIAVARFCGVSQWGHGVGAQIHVIDTPDRDAWQRYYRERLEIATRSLPRYVADLLRR